MIPSTAKAKMMLGILTTKGEEGQSVFARVMDILVQFHAIYKQNRKAFYFIIFEIYINIEAISHLHETIGKMKQVQDIIKLIPFF